MWFILFQTVTLSIGEWCDTEVAVQFGYQINYTCAARATQILEQRCDVITEACHRFLDLTGPFQVGGVPSLPVQFQVENTRYVGCIRDMHIDGKFLDLNDYVWNNGTLPGCAPKNSHCQPNPCDNNGRLWVVEMHWLVKWRSLSFWVHRFNII